LHALVLLLACRPAPSDTTWIALEVYPESLVVGPGASFDLRAVAIDGEGTRTDVAATFASSDREVVAIEGDRADAGEAGTTLITARWRDLAATTSLTVRGDDSLRVTAIDATTGEPLPGVSVTIGDHGSTTDAAGHATVYAREGAVGVFVAGDEQHVPAAVYDVSGREIVVPLRAVASSRVTQAGDLDVAGVPASDAGQRIVGLVAPAIEDALLFDVDPLFAAPRAVDVSGISVQVPGNVVIEDATLDWSLERDAGTPGLWAIAGPVAVVGLGTGLSDTQGAVETFFSSLDRFRWTAAEARTTGGGVQHVRVAPSAEFAETTDVQVPPLPAGFVGTETALVLALGRDGTGDVPIGLATGLGTVTVPRVAEVDSPFDGAPTVLAMVELGGLGAGGARLLSTATVRGTEVQLAAWQSPPRIASFDAITGAFAIFTDPGGELVWIRVASKDAREIDMYAPAGRIAETLPSAADLGYGQTTWTVTALHTDSDTWDGLLATGAIRPELLDGVARTSAITEATFVR
jgi:hypothetical protein